MTGDEAIEQLRRELQEAHSNARQAHVDAALARADERIAAVAVKAEEAGADAEAAIDLATTTRSEILSHQKECVIQNANIQATLAALAPLPAAVAALSSTIDGLKGMRDRQYAESVKRLDAQDVALDEIKKTTGANVVSFHRHMVRGLIGAQMILLAIVAALVEHFVLAKL